ncbi:uncharacterized protein ZBAI_08191 [Zygosaccharomyces bailii ISA1307]|nr:uncharacterized protein ZBAI_08191 [Zygosaccharomyces bailii ISA1307]
MFGQRESVPLCGLPLFHDIKENLLQQKQQLTMSQKTRHRDQAKRRTRNGKKTTAHAQFVPPLSAYNASEERPYLPAGRFDEMTMRIEQEEKRLNSIRNLGCNYIRPIGVGQTLQTLRDRKAAAAQASAEEANAMSLQQQDEQQQEEQQLNFILPPSFQENSGVDSPQDTAMLDDLAGNQMGSSSATHELAASFGQVTSQQNDEDEEEDEISYDYEAEFARVEDVRGEEEGILEKEHNSRFKMLNARDAARDFTIQQFVETSHMESHPYDLEDDFENPQLDVETNQGDSGDFTEVPWVNISDTVQSVDSPRVSSLNSIMGRRMGSTSTVAQGSARLAPPHSRRRISDNNSDHELV